MKIDFHRVFTVIMTVGLVAGLIAIIGINDGNASADVGLQVEVPQADPGPQVIYLVRHAEKADDDPRDPILTDEGKTRAVALADRLASRGIERVLSTDYTRTRDTAYPLASRLGLKVDPYDPRDLHGVAEDVLDDGRTALVVGHSNTTPGLVEALGGEPGEAIDESEYDRLYEITIDGEEVTTQLHRFEIPTAAPVG